MLSALVVTTPSVTAGAVTLGSGEAALGRLGGKPLPLGFWPAVLARLFLFVTLPGITASQGLQSYSFEPRGKPIRYEFFVGFVTETSDWTGSAPWTPRALLSLLPAFWGDDLTPAISFWDPVTHRRSLAPEFPGDAF